MFMSPKKSHKNLEGTLKKPKRVFTPEQKKEIIKGIKECSTIREGLTKYNISSSTYYRWNKPLVEEIKASALSHSPPLVCDEKGGDEGSSEPQKLPKKEKRPINPLYLVLAVLVTGAVLFLTFRQTLNQPEAPTSISPQPQTEIKTDRKPLDKPAPPEEDRRRQLRGLAPTSKEWTGDFDQMLAYRRIRVLLPPSRTLYFNDKGQERGVTGDTVRDFERYLNKKYARKLGKRPLTIFIVPHTRDTLLTGVAEGLGDIAAGNITVTEERLKTVNFVSPEEVPRMSEVLVTGPKSPAVSVMDDLAGKTVHVRKASSYYESLISLNERFKQGRKSLVKITLVPEALEDEDLMEMLNAGVIEFIVVDDWKAKIWSQILLKIKVRKDIVLRSGGKLGWAIRKGSPKLEAEILDFYRNYLKKYGILENRLAQYHKRIKQIKNPTGTDELKRFKQTIVLFEKYGPRYRFDPLMLVAQGYQESELKQHKRSPVGAIGIMQIMPKTGASLKVGNIHLAEPNIHAGAKYMDSLMSRYFRDTNFNEQERTLFAFASYNAGPGKILSMRKMAEKRGLDPNRWFNNVEVVTTERIGMETTTYVRNIYKYYIAYKLMDKNTLEKLKAREHLLQNKKQAE
jgi:membrane-bound lytic murein transglycosylase MltF/transposase-like protein